MLETNRFVFIVLTIAFSVCVLNTATHSACDSKRDCERYWHSRGWICVRDFNNPSNDICYKGIPNRRDAIDCEARKDGSEWHYDEARCHRPRNAPRSPNTGFLPQTPPSPPQTPPSPPQNPSSPPQNPSSPPQNPSSPPQNPPSDALSSPEANTLATVFEETVNDILSEDTTEPDADSEEDTDSPENTLGVDPLPLDPNQQGISSVEATSGISEKPQSKQRRPENPELVPDEDTAKPEDIFITEIMVDTLEDTLPQWIELTNYSTKEVNLKGWRMKIFNKFDENAYSKSKEVYLNNIVLGSSTSEGEDDKNRVALITFRLWGLKGRKSANLDLHDIFSYDLYRGYNILSKVAFRIELIPPPNMDRRKADVAGNLPKKTLFFELWNLPEQSEERRSSLIRRKNEGWMQSKGVSRDNWLLAHKTELADEKPSKIWYGKDDDIGSPGRVDDPMMIDAPEVPAAPTLIRKLKLTTSWGSLKKVK